MQTQTITVLVGEEGAGVGAPNSGFGPAGISPALLLLIITVAVIIVIATITVVAKFKARRYRKYPSFRGFGVLAILGVATASLVFTLPNVSAAPTLTLGTDDPNIAVAVPKGGGTATATMSLLVSTANATGYTLTAGLTAREPGIKTSIQGGNMSASSALSASGAPLVLKRTGVARTNDEVSTVLTFTIDGTVKEGKKTLQLSYVATDNSPAPHNPTDPTDPGTPAAPTTMQSLTKAYCTNSMTTYDGTNPDAILSLTDARGGTTQTYEVAKLADGNCWMLTNLKLGSTTAPITLTPADTNIVANFTLPQVAASTPVDTEEEEAAAYDTPQVHGPVPGDTGTGDTNYGYLYNWSAATAGESRASMPGDGTHDNAAPHSICPASWRLPTSDYLYDEEGEPYDYGGDFGGLYRALGGTVEDPSTAVLGWYGAFKAVSSGLWAGGFGDQGDDGTLWASAASPGYPSFAVGAGFNPDGVNPSDGSGRYYGMGVRCLLN